MSAAPPGGVVPASMVAPATRGERRCTYTGCDRPEHGSDFHHIEAGRRSGGQDWSPLAGSTLCNACYQQYKRRGTLERSRNKPIAAGARRCTYANCEKPDHGTKFFLIEQGKNTANKDWSSIAGMVLCKACYQQFIRSGKLERSRNKPLTNGAKRCSYPECDRPEHGSCFYQIETGKTAGGQDWTGLVGQVLCKACYEQYKARGTLERSGRPMATTSSHTKAAGAKPEPVAAVKATAGVALVAAAAVTAVPGGTKRPAPPAPASSEEAAKKAKAAAAAAAVPIQPPPPGGIAS